MRRQPSIPCASIDNIAQSDRWWGGGRHPHRRREARRSRAVHRIASLQRPVAGSGPTTLRKIRTAAQDLGYSRPSRGSSNRSGRRHDGGRDRPGHRQPRLVPSSRPRRRRLAPRQNGGARRPDFQPDREREVITQLRGGRRDRGLLAAARVAGRAPSSAAHAGGARNREAAGADCIVSDATDGLRADPRPPRALGHRRLVYVQGSQRSWSNPTASRSPARSPPPRAGAATAPAGRPRRWQVHGRSSDVVASGASAAIAHTRLVASA